jgi:nicotinate-nucleotide adenylyltransferase
MKKSIGILGGTFDPIHHGHLRLAIEAQETLNIDEVRLIPARQSPHRQPPYASEEQRLKMIELATAEINGVIVDDRELQREGRSYTIDTVKSLRNEFSQSTIALIIGMDAFKTFNSWRDWMSILDYVHIILVDRPESDENFSDLELKDYYLKNKSEKMSDAMQTPAGQILKIEIPKLEISSTHIRQQLINDLDVRYLLPTKVIDYIKEESLYH